MDPVESVRPDLDQLLGEPDRLLDPGGPGPPGRRARGMPGGRRDDPQLLGRRPGRPRDDRRPLAGAGGLRLLRLGERAVSSRRSACPGWSPSWPPGVPLAAALRQGESEPFGRPWRLIYLGDPLYRLPRRSRPGRGFAHGRGARGNPERLDPTTWRGLAPAYADWPAARSRRRRSSSRARRRHPGRSPAAMVPGRRGRRARLGTPPRPVDRRSRAPGIGLASGLEANPPRTARPAAPPGLRRADRRRPEPVGRLGRAAIAAVADPAGRAPAPRLGGDGDRGDAPAGAGRPRPRSGATPRPRPANCSMRWAARPGRPGRASPGSSPSAPRPCCEGRERHARRESAMPRHRFPQGKTPSAISSRRSLRASG